MKMMELLKKRSKPGKMKIDLVIDIPTRGTVLAGVVEDGCIKVGDTVEIHSADGKIQRASVEGMEQSRRAVNVVFEGNPVGILIKVKASLISEGDMLVVV